MDDVRVVLARCARGRQTFGIRVEGTDRSRWALTWAFPVQEGAARREGYDRSEITGRFDIRDGYPGCPHCENAGFFRCECGRLGCWDGEVPEVTCPWCGSRGVLEGEVDRMTAGHDH
ncbi:MAG TPA: TerY-C metal binding domain-containing protein [Longimicrobium sp.]|nr:TerY-C metal binding domain-containing protein [Longimicrobium sp.]